MCATNAIGGNALSSEDCKGAAGYASQNPEVTLRKRLKLLSLSKQNNNLQGETYSFIYNEEQPLPYKNILRYGLLGILQWRRKYIFTYRLPPHTYTLY